MSFSEALIFLRNGKKLYRESWNGKNLSVYFYEPPVQTMTTEQMVENNYIMPHFRIWARDQKTVNAWVPSVSDILAFDWNICKEGE